MNTKFDMTILREKMSHAHLKSGDSSYEKRTALQLEYDEAGLGWG